MTRIVVCCVALLVAARAWADPKQEAREHRARARDAHAAGKYDEALAELTAAYELDPQPSLLFAIAQVHLKRGDCERAIEFYQRFLASHPSAREVGMVKEAIRTCEVAIAVAKAHPAAPPAEAPVPEGPPPPAPPSKPPPAASAPIVHRPPRHAAWYADWLGDASVIAGLAAGGVAGEQYLAARGDRSDADSATSYRDYHTLIDRSSRERDIAIGCAAGGALLITLGIVRYVVHDRSEREPVVGVAAAPGGTMFVVAGRM